MSTAKKNRHSRAKSLFAKRILWGKLRRRDRNAPETDRVKFLKKITLFNGLSKGQLEEVAQIFHERHYSADEFIFEVNQPGAALFVIQEGEVSVEMPSSDENEHTQLAMLQKDSFLGEMALLDGSPRSASARAVRPSVILALSRTDLAKLIQTDPDIASQIYKSLASIIGSRLKATNELLDKELEAAS